MKLSGAEISRCRVLSLRHLNEVELHGRLAAEDGHGHFELALVVVEFFHHAVETAEGAFDDPDLVASLEVELGAGLFLTGFHQRKNSFRFTRPHRGRTILAAHKASDFGNILNLMPGQVGHGHANHHVTGIELPGGGTLLTALAELDDLFGGDDHILDAAIVLTGTHQLADHLLYSLLKAGVGVQDVPVASSLIGSRFRIDGESGDAFLLSHCNYP